MVIITIKTERAEVLNRYDVYAHKKRTQNKMDSFL